MGQGFPTRPSRLAFGPLVHENRFPVQEPKKEIGAETFDLDYWQVAGMGVTAFRAYASFDVSGAGAVAALPEASGEAWDPEGGVAPALSKQAVGHYRLTYAATYPDESSVQQNTSLIDAFPKVRFTAAASVLYLAYAEVLPSLREVDIFVYSTAFALTDPINQRVSVWIM